MRFYHISRIKIVSTITLFLNNRAFKLEKKDACFDNICGYEYSMMRDKLFEICISFYPMQGSLS